MKFDFCTRNVDFRVSGSAENGDGLTLEGYATVYDTKTEIDSWLEGHFLESFSRGAFKKTLNEREPIMQFDHGHDSRTGSVPIGKYQELREDTEGLYVRGRLFDNPLVHPVRDAIAGGAITGMSIRFRATRDEWRDAKGKLIKDDMELFELLYSEDESNPRLPVERIIREAQLSEAGPVVFPAYATTSVGVRDQKQDEAARAELVRQYRRSMLKREPADGPNIDTYVSKADETRVADLLRDGFTAESVREAVAKDDLTLLKHTEPDTFKRWLDAETAWRTQQSKDFEERRRRLRGHLAESRPPEKTDAAHKGTSENRDTKKTTTEQPRKAVRLMNIHELKARAAELRTTLLGLDEEFRDAAMPDERRAEFDEAERELAEVELKITGITERAEKMRKLAADAVARQGEDGNGSTERGTEQGGHTDRRRGEPGHTRVDNPHDLEAIRKAFPGDDEYRDALRSNALRVIEKGRFASVTTRDKAQETIQRMIDNEGEDAAVSNRILLTGSREYERAFFRMAGCMNLDALRDDDRKVLSRVNEEIRAQALGVDAAGGYAVPVFLDPTVLLQNNGVENHIRQLARTVQITGKEYQVPTTSGTTVVRGAEGSVAPDNTITLGIKTVRTNRVQGFVPFSIEIDQDYGQLRSLIAEVLSDAKDVEEAASFTLGDGTGTNANGVIGTLSGNTVATTSVGAFVVQDVYKLEQSLAPRYLTDRAAFLATHTMYNNIRGFGTTDGHALWERIGAGQPQQLLGYRAMQSSSMATATTTGSKIMLFGDFNNFLIVDRIGMQVEFIPNLMDPTTGRPTGQRGIYAIWRNNSKILNDAAFKLLVVA